MSTPFGSTRSVVTQNYALFPPDGLVTSSVPGWSDAQCQIVIAPQLGANFYQLFVTLGERGAGLFAANEAERVVFVLEGSVEVRVGTQQGVLAAGGFCYASPFEVLQIGAATPAPRLLIFQRDYLVLNGVEPPAPIIGHEDDVAAQPFLGDEGAMLKVLLPDMPAFDMAVNIFTFQPGATLPFVETHIMEHGMTFIQGGGIYRLASDWHPVQMGDTIWMAPYCPQWFVATGKTPARYIYYKDINRDPL